MDQLRHPLGYLQREFYINASCAIEAHGRADSSFVERLLMQCRGMAPGFRVMLFGFDWARDENGAPMQEYSTFHVPDDYVAALAARHPQHFEWVASIHPYDPQALERLESAAARGARAIKWLPSAQNIDPADARCDPFYARLAALGMPLIAHAGDERAVKGFGEQLGNPLRLRRPLDAGVKVVVAHCASLGSAHGEAGEVSNFDLFTQLMEEERYRNNLYGDISAITQYNRMHVIAALLERREWHARLLNGSDYPLPGVVPLVPLEALVDAQLLDATAVDPLARLRKYNVLLFDFVLKRSLRLGGQVFAASVFETAPAFTRTA
jgi:mannonate dehydratase